MCLASLLAHAQSPTSAELDARRLRDAGDLAAAARLLGAALADEPDNAGVAGLLGETLYWLQDVAGARAVYDTALVRHPRDASLRLSYARMLAETGDRAGARAVLAPLRAPPPGATRGAAAEVDALLGTIAYWDGDFTTARRLFEAALRADPAQADARRQLQEILAATRSWVRISPDASHDDQPLDRVGIGLEAGWFATPLVPVTVRFHPGRYALELDEGTTRGWWQGEAAVRHFAPALRLDTELAAGLLRHPGGAEAIDWHGRAMVGLRLPAHLTAEVRVDRTPYLHTRASLDTRVIARSATGVLRWQHPRGWLGEAAYGRQQFPDGNIVASAWAWQLVPLIGTPVGELQAGYAFGREHAGESRFVLANPTQPFLPGDPRYSTAGRYDPYYTPSRLVSHSAIAAATLRPSATTTIRAGGAYALHAIEDAPALSVSAGQVLRTMSPRTFSPWNARGSIEIALPNGLTLSADGEFGRAAFYRWSKGGVHLTYHFASGAGSRTVGP